MTLQLLLWAQSASWNRIKLIFINEMSETCFKTEQKQCRRQGKVTGKQEKINPEIWDWNQDEDRAEDGDKEQNCSVMEADYEDWRSQVRISCHTKWMDASLIPNRGWYSDVHGGAQFKNFLNLMPSN